MRCWNCNREIPRQAKVCVHCEAPVMEEPTEEEMQGAADLLEQLPPETAAELHQAFLDSATAEEFADRILVGNCPKCDGVNTSHCENDPEIGELLVGRCYDCGQLWCTECGRLLEPQAAVCECWNEEESPEHP
jgi:hypothetical protein